MVANEDFDQQIKAAEQELATVERNTAVERQKIKAEQSALKAELENNRPSASRKSAQHPRDCLRCTIAWQTDDSISESRKFATRLAPFVASASGRMCFRNFAAKIAKMFFNVRRVRGFCTT